MIARPAQYLLRFDDLCPTVSARRWQRFLPLIEEFGIQPILAVVPDNQDPELKLSPPDPDFWDGDARDGSRGSRNRHCMATGISARSTRPQPAAVAPRDGVCRRSRRTQREWIHEGLAILRGHGLNPVWVAPRHGFDLPLSRAAGAGNRSLSDGFARGPFLTRRHHLDSAAALGTGRETERPLDYLRSQQYRDRYSGLCTAHLPRQTRGAIHLGAPRSGRVRTNGAKPSRAAH